MTNTFETVAQLAQDCQEFAALNERYRLGESDWYERSVGFDTSESGIFWRANFSANRCYDEGAFQGYAFKLFVSCHGEVGVVPEAMQFAARQQQEILPAKEDIREVGVDYHAMYEVSQYGSLGWHITRDYEYIFDDLDPDDPHSYEEGLVSETISTHVAEKWPYGSEDTATDTKDILRQMETDMHLSQARNVFRMISREEFQDFDLETIMPEELLQEIEDR